jgi:integrase
MTDRSGKSGKEVAKPKSAGRSKTDARYWTDRIFFPTFTKDGERLMARHYSARIAYLKLRHTFPLGTGNKETAAKTAATIFESLQRKGWKETLAKYAPTHAAKKPATVGELIREAQACSSVAPDTLADYTRSFRSIVADVEGIKSVVPITRGKRVLDPVTGKHRIVKVATSKDIRFDPSTEAGEAWRKRVDAVPLSRITPEKIQKWKLSYVRDNGGDDYEQERRAKNTANSKLRQAKALFSKNVLPYVQRSLVLPSPLPFDGLTFFPRQSMRYVSRIDARALIRSAVETLAETDPEAFKIFLLGIMAGLRAGEIDMLLWQQVNLDEETVTIKATPYFKPKAETSVGVVRIEPETAELLRGYRARAKGDFVIESDRPARTKGRNRNRRAKDAFDALTKWLKAQGVTAYKPLHELRKEFGSLVCERGGLYAASRALRHADVAITAAHYLDEKERATVGLGQFLTAPAKSADETIVDIKKGRRVG